MHGARFALERTPRACSCNQKFVKSRSQRSESQEAKEKIEAKKQRAKPDIGFIK